MKQHLIYIEVHSQIVRWKRVKLSVHPPDNSVFEPKGLIRLNILSLDDEVSSTGSVLYEEQCPAASIDFSFMPVDHLLWKRFPLCASSSGWHLLTNLHSRFTLHHFLCAYYGPAEQPNFKLRSNYVYREYERDRKGAVCGIDHSAPFEQRCPFTSDNQLRWIRFFTNRPSSLLLTGARHLVYQLNELVKPVLLLWCWLTEKDLLVKIKSEVSVLCQ